MNNDFFKYERVDVELGGGGGKRGEKESVEKGKIIHFKGEAGKEGGGRGGRGRGRGRKGSMIG